MAITALCACGGGSSSAPSNSAPPAQTPSPDGPTAPAGTTTVGAAGGKVATSDGKFSLTIASGALKGDTYFKITAQSTLTALPTGYVLLAGTGYEIDWTGAGFAGQAAATLRFANPPQPAQAAGKRALAPREQVQTPRLKSGGSQPLDASNPTVSVVTCGNTSQVYATTTDPDASDYSDTSAVLCSPSTAGGTQVGLAQPGPGQFPSISTQPAAVSDGAGDTATFVVVAAGAPTLAYQWRRDGVDIPDAINPSYSFTVAASDSGAKFSVVVSNVFGRVTSSEAALTVGPPKPPAPPYWGTPTEIIPFGPAVDLPRVGQVAGLNLLVWNNNGLLDSDYDTRVPGDPKIHDLALPIRSRPIVLSGPNLAVGYIVFVDDDGTSSCQAGFGNRLSAIAVGLSSENGPYPSSPRLTLYPSTDCIITFSAAMTRDPVVGAAVAFAVQEQSTNTIKTGVAGAKLSGSVVNGVPEATWTPTTATGTALPTSSDCAQGFLTTDGMMGSLQVMQLATHAASLATLAFVSRSANPSVTCAATLSGSGWSTASVLFDNSDEAEPVVAVDDAGRTLVLASRIVDPMASVLTYAMTAALRVSDGAQWQVQGLDTRDGAALASAAFDGSGNAFVVWRPNSNSGKSVVYSTRHTAAGAWESVQSLSAPTAVETRYPRVCVDPDGRAIALFEQGASAAGPFTVFSTLWKKGLWSDLAPIQVDANDGRFAECARNVDLSETPEVAWLETNPADATQHRIMSALLQVVE